MAKRKRRTKKSKQKPAGDVFVSLKRMLIMACILLVCLFVLLYIHEYASQPEKKRSSGKKTTTSVTPAKPADTTRKPTVTPAGAIPPKSEIPVLRSGANERIVEHEGYTLSFNPVYKIANWVAYELTVHEAQSGKSNRFDKFLLDPALPDLTARNEDYTRSGYDRGHLVPAADMKWSAKAMRESFYLSNIVPQKPKLNRGIWKELEEQVRAWAVTDSALLIVAGPVIRPRLKRLGKSRVAVPDTLYKVIVSPYGKDPKGIAFLFANRDYGRTPLTTLAVPIDRVEAVTGIDFFPRLPDELERRIEESVCLEKWNFN